MGRVSDMKIENDQDIADAFERCDADVLELVTRFNMELRRAGHSHYFVHSLRVCALDGSHDPDFDEIISAT